MLRQSPQDRFVVQRSGVLYYWRRVLNARRTIDARTPADGETARELRQATRSISQRIGAPKA
jgi:hypothetical protein